MPGTNIIDFLAIAMCTRHFSSVFSIVTRDFHTCPVARGRFRYFNIHKKCVNPQQQEDQHFEKEALKVDFGPSYLDQLSNIWKEKTAVQREMQFKKEDKLVKHDSNYWLPKVEPSTLKLEYQNVEALKNAPESVKKIYSVEYGERKDLTALWKHLIREKVKQNPMDKAYSVESRIANRTANIRQLTMLLESMERKPGWLRKIIHLSVASRRKMLRLLRQTDQASFENVLNQLKIAYHVPPLPEDLPKHTRKGWVESIVDRKCDLIREEKLRRYHATLKKDHEEFVAKRDAAVKQLTAEIEQLQSDLQAIKTEDDVALNVKGRYVGDTISEVSEHLMLNYFYRRPSGTAKSDS